MADDTDRILNQYGPQDDEHGFLFSRVGGDLKFNPYEAIKKFMAYRAPPGALSTSGDDTPVRDAADVAGWVGMSGLGLNAFGAVPANALGSAGAKAPQALRASVPPRIENPIRAYHGSPHDFDKFDLSKIGTGEGAQAYGHGLYFAESEPVAKSYRDKLTDGASFIRPDGTHWDPGSLSHLNVRVIARRHGIEAAIDAAKKLAVPPWTDATVLAGKDLRALEKLQAAGGVKPNPGHMYEVGIHATPISS